jgi:ankyrin repeat protein
MRADVNQADEDGKTPLLQAVFRGRTDVAKALIDAGADVNHIYDEDWFTILYVAVLKGYLEIVKMLVEAGADLHSVDSNGRTLQKVAAEGNHPNVLEYLKLVGSNWNIGPDSQYLNVPEFLQDRYLATYWSLKKSGLSDDIIRKVMAKIKL